MSQNHNSKLFGLNFSLLRREMWPKRDHLHGDVRKVSAQEYLQTLKALQEHGSEVTNTSVGSQRTNE